MYGLTKSKVLQPLVLALLVVLLVSCDSGTEPEVSLIHGGPDNAAADGSYTEEIVSIHGIASLEAVSLGGVEQWVLIRGENTSNPVLIFLHGGPGSPGIAYGRFAFKPLESRFTVVTWDQRGCGKSYQAGIDPLTLTFDRFMDDAHELMMTMSARFQTEKVFLMGVSWGAILGVHIAHAYPELIHAYIGIGQPVNLTRGLGISLEAAIARATELANEEVLAQLTEIQALWLADPAAAWEQTGPVADFLESQGFGDLHDLSLYASLSLEAGPLTEYTAQDIANEQNWRSLYDAAPVKNDVEWLMAIDLPSDVPRLDVPGFFLNGRYDYKAPTELVEEYVDGLEAPAGKQFIPFDESAHVLFLEERTLFRSTMLNTVAGVLPSSSFQ